MKMLFSEPKRIICSNPDSPFCYFGWPSIERLHDGTLAMVVSGFRLKHVCPFGKGVISYSRDEGKTWSAPAVVLDTPLDDRDCGLVRFGENRAILTSFNNTTKMQRAYNGLSDSEHTPKSAEQKNLIEAYLRYLDATDAEEKFLGSTYRISDDGGYSFGPVRIAPISSPHGPCVLNDGTLFYVGRKFDDEDASAAATHLQCWKLNADDEFDYVSSIENVADEYGPLLSCEPHSICLPDGKIIVHIRVQRGGEHRIFTIYQSESTDNGLTFTAPRPLLPELGGSPAHLIRHSGGVLISVYGYREAPYGIRAMFSRDNGETWDTDWVLDCDCANGDLGYPATVELDDGSLLTVYYENIGGQSVVMQKIWTLPNL